MPPITGGLRSKRKRTPIRWLRPIRPLPITDGNGTIGIMEYWSSGVMGQNKKGFLSFPIFQYSSTPILQWFL
jgi:hypothetical protein